MYDIVTFGSATHDVFMSSKKLKAIKSDQFDTQKGLCVALGSKIEMDDFFFAMGGTGANTAVTFARQGLKTCYCGSIGKDYAGQGVKDEFAKHGVLLDLLKEIEKYPTAFSVIISLPKIGRSILKKLGACHFITEKDIDFNKLKKTKWIYLGSLSGQAYKIVKSVINFASKNKIKIAANPVGTSQLSIGLKSLISFLNKMDILIVNQEEASRITGIDYKKEKDVFKKLDKIVDGIVVVTKGPKGVVVSDGKYLYSAGIPKSGLVDRTGAGDAFGSAFVAGWIDKKDISHAIQLGTANATSVLQKFGATNGLLRKGEWGKWKKVEVKKIKI
jgi:sugar/nucleoside kinase (ribokinase family)